MKTVELYHRFSSVKWAYFLQLCHFVVPSCCMVLVMPGYIINLKTCCSYVPVGGCYIVANWFACFLPLFFLPLIPSFPSSFSSYALPPSLPSLPLHFVCSILLSLSRSHMMINISTGYQQLAPYFNSVYTCCSPLIP